MRRRDFITLIGGTAVALPLATRAQQLDRLRRVAVLAPDYSQDDREGQARIAAFVDTLRKQGWSEGRNVHVEYRWAGSNTDRVNTQAAELIHSSPDVIVADGNIALAELHRLTSTIPIVFVQVADSVGSGFVPGLVRPGGNITGFENFEPAMGSKWLGLLKEAAPNVSRVVVLFGSNSTGNVAFHYAAQAVAPSLGITVTAVDVQSHEIEPAVTTFASRADGGLVVLPHSKTISDRSSIMTLAARHCRRSIRSGTSQPKAGLSPMARIRTIDGEGQQPTSTAFCGARSRAISRSRRRPSTSWWSISRLRRRSG